MHTSAPETSICASLWNSGLNEARPIHTATPIAMLVASASAAARIGATHRFQIAPLGCWRYVAGAAGSNTRPHSGQAWCRNPSRMYPQPRQYLVGRMTCIVDSIGADASIAVRSPAVRVRGMVDHNPRSNRSAERSSAARRVGLSAVSVRADVDGSAHAASAVDQLSAVFRAHAGAEAELAGPFDKAASFGVVSGHLFKSLSCDATRR